MISTAPDTVSLMHSHTMSPSQAVGADLITERIVHTFLDFNPKVIREVLLDLEQRHPCMEESSLGV